MFLERNGNKNNNRLSKIAGTMALSNRSNGSMRERERRTACAIMGEVRMPFCISCQLVVGQSKKGGQCGGHRPAIVGGMLCSSAN
jgi:hypothetical protein